VQRGEFEKSDVNCGGSTEGEVNQWGIPVQKPVMALKKKLVVKKRGTELAGGKKDGLGDSRIWRLWRPNAAWPKPSEKRSQKDGSKRS